MEEKNKDVTPNHKDHQSFEIDPKSSPEEVLRFLSLASSLDKEMQPAQTQKASLSSEQSSATISTTQTYGKSTYLTTCREQDSSSQAATEVVKKLWFLKITEQQNAERAVEEKQLQTTDFTYLESDALACRSMFKQPVIKTKTMDVTELSHNCLYFQTTKVCAKSRKHSKITIVILSMSRQVET